MLANHIERRRDNGNLQGRETAENKKIRHKLQKVQNKY